MSNPVGLYPYKALPVVYDPVAMIALEPVGIPRPLGRMNCWAIAILQLLANAPDLAAKVLAGQTELSSLLRQYFAAQASGNDTARNIDAQSMRPYSDRLLSQSASSTEDVVDGLEGILETLEVEYTFSQRIGEQSYGGIRCERTVSLNLASDERDFLKLFENFFSCDLEDGRRVRLQFYDIPNDLILQTKRYAHNGARPAFLKDPIESVPFDFRLNGKYTFQGNEAHYELLSGILLRDGHYTAILKKSDNWYHVDDDKVKPISNEEAKEFLSSSYVLHFRKIERDSEFSDWTVT